jgi:MFS family permease
MIIGGTVYTFTQDLGTLLVTAVLVSIGGRLPYTPAEQAFLTEKVSDEDRTKAFSINSFLGTIAGILGSLVAGLPELLQSWGIPELISYRPLFAVFSVTGVITFASFTLIEETVPSSSVDEIEAAEATDVDGGSS